MKSLLKTTLFSLLLIHWFTVAQAKSSESMPHYQLKVNIMPEDGMLKANLKLSVDNSFLQSGTLQLFSNREADISFIKADPSAEVSVDSLDKLRNKITIDFSDLKESEVVISMTYTLKIPKNHKVNRITEEWVELNTDSFWLPLINGFPRFNYEMDLNIDSAYTVMTGDIKKDQDQTDYMIIQSRLPRLDISFSAAKKFYSVEGKFVKVSSINPEVKIDSVKILADQVLAFLNQYIDEPKDFNHKRNVVISPREEVGYSRKNYIVLSDIQDKSDLELAGFLAHEFSHYWFSDADIRSKHYWLSESFAEYISMIYIKEKYSLQEFENNIEKKKKRIEGNKKVLSDYESRPSYLAMYFKGPLVLHQFEQYIGGENFKILINDFVDKSISTNQGLYELIESKFGSDAVAKLKELRATI